MDQLKSIDSAVLDENIEQLNEVKGQKPAIDPEKASFFAETFCGSSEETEKALLSLEQFVLQSSGSSLGRSVDSLFHKVLTSLLNRLDAEDPDSALIRLHKKVLSDLSNVFTLHNVMRDMLKTYSDCKSHLKRTTLLEILTAIVRSDGPDAYFAFKDTPVQSQIPSSSFGLKGYSFSCWIRLSPGQTGIYNFVSILSDDGAGLLLFLSGNRIEARLPNYQSNSPFVFDYPIPFDKWVHLTFLHSPQSKPDLETKLSQGQMVMYADSVPVASLAIPLFDVFTPSEFMVNVGGFYGDMSVFHLFGLCLSIKQIRSIYASGPAFAPSFIVKSNLVLARFVPIHNLNSGYIPGTIQRVSPRNAVNGIVQTDSWLPFSSFHGPETSIVLRPNNKKVFFTRGGLHLVLWTVSPLLNGMGFESSDEVFGVLMLISELLWNNPAHLHQLSEIGVFSLKYFLIDPIPEHLRDKTVLKGFDALVTVLQPLLKIPTVSSDLFMDAFRFLLLDFNFWKSNDVFEKCVHLSLKISIANAQLASFRSAIDCSFFLEQIRAICPSAFTFSDSTESCLSMVEMEINCMFALLKEPRDITESFLSDLMELMEDCKSPLIFGKLSTFFLSLLRSFFSLVSDFLMDPKPSKLRYSIFFEHLADELDSTRDTCIKILGVVLKGRPSKTQQSFATQISTALSLKCSKYPLPLPIADTLIELIVGQVDLNSESSLKSFADENLIVFPQFLFSALNLAKSSDISVKEKVLLESLTLLRTHQNNALSVYKTDLWQESFISLLESSSSEEILKELTVQCVQSVLWATFNAHDMGWLVLDQFLWSLSQSESISDPFELRISIALQIATKISRIGVEDTRPKNFMVSNYKMSLLIVEKWIFCDPSSFVHQMRPPSCNEEALLERLPQALVYLSKLERRRLQLYRTAFRYVESVLGNPLCSLSLQKTAFRFIRAVFIENDDLHTSESEKAYHVVLYLLKGTMERFLKSGEAEGISSIRVLIVEVFDKIGLGSFKEMLAETPSSLSKMKRVDSSEWETVESKENIEIECQEDVLMVLYQCQSVDKAFLWYSDCLRRFDEGMFNRQDKVSEKMKSFSMDVMARKRKEEEIVVLKYFLRPIAKKSAKTPCIALAIDHRQFDMTREKLNEFGDEFKSLYCKNEMFWKLDPTETPVRQRLMVQMNFEGHSHANAAIVVSKPVTAQVLMEEAILQQNVQIPLNEFDEEESAEMSQDEVQDLLLLGVSDEMEEKVGKEAFSVRETIITTTSTLVTPLGRVSGTFTVTSSFTEFKGNEWTDFVSLSEPPLEPTERLVHLSHSQIRQILPRRFLLQPNSVEIFLKNRQNHFFTFPIEQRNKIFKTLCEILRLPPELNPKRRVLYSGVTERWRKGKISNFEYLMHLNTFSGRTFNDLNQYPVFPWILQDYTSANIDLTDENVYRDLSKPIGALNPSRAQIFREKYKEAEASGTDTLPPWHYGSHYSNAGVVLHYLIRLEPFTSLAVQIQGGKFDLADRLFHSVKSAWDLSYNNISDVKELIPEFFCLPEFLLNKNNLQLGRKQDEHKVDDVILPQWARSTHHFVSTNRLALESEYVSKNLHHWIDLVFGYKQKGEEAVKALNVFFYLTYEGAVDIDAIEDESMREATISQISHFGQTPSQLFTSPHPQREVSSTIEEFSLPFDFPVNYGPLLVHRYDSCIGFNGDLRVSAGDQISHLVSAGGRLMLTRFDVSQMMMKLIRESKGKTRKEKTRQTAVSAAASAFSSISNATFGTSSRNSSKCLFESQIPLDALAVSANGKFCFAGGSSNFSLKCFLSSSGDCISSVIGHCAQVTCVHHGHDQSSVVSGALDGSVTIWNMFARRYDSHHVPPLANGHNHIFSVHTSKVIDISHSLALGIIVSISENGEMALCSIHRKSFVKFIDIDVHPMKSIICESGRIVVYATREGDSVLLLFDTNGSFLLETKCDEVTVLRTTLRKEYVVTGDTNGMVRFFDPVFLELVQEFDCCQLRLGPKGNEMSQNDIVEEEKTSIIKSPVQCIDADPRGAYFIVALEDGRVLLYPLPRMLGLSEFQVLFDMLAPTVSSVSENIYYQILTFADGKTDDPEDQDRASRNPVTSVLKSVGGSIRGFFQ